MNLREVVRKHARVVEALSGFCLLPVSLLRVDAVALGDRNDRCLEGGKEPRHSFGVVLGRHGRQSTVQVLACQLALRLGRHDPNVTSSGGAGRWR